MQSITSITPKEIVAGITGHYAHGENLTFGLVEIKGGSELPAHQHPHEQITYILEGELDMVIGGKPCLLKAGMYYVIPPNIPHGATAKTDCRVIDVFSPVREDYR